MAVNRLMPLARKQMGRTKVCMHFPLPTGRLVCALYTYCLCIAIYPVDYNKDGDIIDDVRPSPFVVDLGTIAEV